MIKLDKLIDGLAAHYGYIEFIDDVAAGLIKDTLNQYPQIPNPVSKEQFVESKIYDYLIGLVNVRIVERVKEDAAKTAPVLTKDEVINAVSAEIK